jgi:hypothetical protein
MLIREIIIVYPENYSKYRNYVGKVRSFLMLELVVHLIKCRLCLLNPFVLCVMRFDAPM